MTRVDIVAKVFVLNDAGELLLLQRSETDVRRPLDWDIPGGGVEQDETAEQAVVREAAEEAGLQLTVSAHELVATRTEYVPADDGQPDRNITWLFFLVRSPDIAVTLSFEHTAYQWAKPAEALELLTYHVQHEALQHIADAKFFD